jgi:hypothetical protein
MGMNSINSVGTYHPVPIWLCAFARLFKGVDNITTPEPQTMCDQPPNLIGGTAMSVSVGRPFEKYKRIAYRPACCHVIPNI